MIRLHRLNGSELVVNAELIETLETGPETCICLATGNKVLVRESAEEITALVVEYRRRVAASAAPGPVNPIRGFERTS